MHKVVIQRADYENCREAIDRIFASFALGVKGKKVLVKPNALRASDPEQGIVTHPAVVLAIVQKLEELDAAAIIVGDNPGMRYYGANEETFRQTGLMKAAKGYYRNIGNDGVEVNLVSDLVDRLTVSQAVLEADVVISVPKFKTHGLTIATGAIKNSYGIIPGALKANLHMKAGNALRFSELLVDVFSVKIPDLFIVDAVVGMEGNGPVSTELRHIGQILASDNAVALDATIVQMMGLDPRTVPFLEIAKQHGLGDYNMTSIDIVGDLAAIPHFKVPPWVEKASAIPGGQKERLLKLSRSRPHADEKLCTGCQTCVEHCPAEALSMVAGLPSVDDERCIACFCCQEICPEMAITLR